MMSSAQRSDHQTPAALVVGLGLTGWSVVRYLRQRGDQVVVTDTRREPPYLDQLRIAYPEVPFHHDMPSDEMALYDQVVASPGVAAAGDHVVGDIELFVQKTRAPIIAITGSNGKSTVTMLVTMMLRAGGYDALEGGNIGTPALDLLSQPVPDFYVLELSSFQLETTRSLQARSAVVLNISEDHMDRYTDLEDYTDAKATVLHCAETMVINRDDPVVAAMPSRFAPVEDDKLISFGLDQPEGDNQIGLQDDDGVNWLVKGGQRLARVDQILLQGRQNQANVLAAMALVSAAGVELSQGVIGGALDYRGLPHRCELVASEQGVKWINDSKGTNVGATLAAISGCEKPLILIAGGQAKGADFSPLREAVEDAAKLVVLIGEDAEKIASAVDDVTEVQRAPSLEQAIEIAATNARQGDSVLFSPACASFDMFRSYGHRGDEFRKAVHKRLAANHGAAT